VNLSAPSSLLATSVEIAAAIESARYLGVSLGSLERLMRSGLAYIRVGNLVRFRPEDLADYIEQRRVRRSGDAA
jgi:excisionase family DNA binding protein